MGEEEARASPPPPSFFPKDPQSSRLTPSTDRWVPIHFTISPSSSSFPLNFSFSLSPLLPPPPLLLPNTGGMAAAAADWGRARAAGSGGGGGELFAKQ